MKILVAAIITVENRRLAITAGHLRELDVILYTTSILTSLLSTGAAGPAKWLACMAQTSRHFSKELSGAMELFNAY